MVLPSNSAMRPWFSGPAVVDKLPLLVLLTAAAFCATLLSFVREPVFYLGDGGMKLLATQQFAKGVFTSELRLPAEDWVKLLWQSGYYPLEPPFVFEIGGRHVVGQPLIFPAASAPFYRLFGYRGLYFLPAASAVLLAAGMHIAARRIGLSAAALAIAHAGWATSYLMVYSAIFWDHVPGTMLAWWGIFPVIESFSHRVTPRRLGMAGLFLGVSGWFRPECLALAAIVIVMWGPVAARRAMLSEWAAFSAVTIAVMGGFFALNFYTFGHVLGTHAVPVFNRSEADHLRAAVQLVAFFGRELLRFAPIAVFVAYLAIRMGFAKTRQGTASFWFLVTSAVLFVFAVSYMVPTEGGLQWGPRHVIPVVPLLSLAAGIGWQQATLRADRTNYSLTFALAVAVIGYGVWLNMWVGGHNLRNNYQLKMLPTIRLVEATGIDQIVVTDQSTAQEMAALMQDHRFYLAPQDERQPRRLARLADAFEAAGRQHFLVIVSVEPDTRDLLAPPTANGTAHCWTRRHLGTNTVGYVVYEFSRC